MEYQRIAVAGFFPCLVRFLFWGVPGTVGAGACGLVFGTLLGPEATGPGGAALAVLFRDLCFWFPGCTDHACFGPFAGCVCGVCGTGLLFENYIVDASIFYKKQFPRI